MTRTTRLSTKKLKARPDPVQDLIESKERLERARIKQTRAMYDEMEKVVRIACAMTEKDWRTFAALEFWKGKRIPSQRPARAKRVRLATQFLFEASDGTERQWALDWAKAANVLLRENGSADGLADAFRRETKTGVLLRPKKRLAKKMAASKAGGRELDGKLDGSGAKAKRSDHEAGGKKRKMGTADAGPKKRDALRPEPKVTFRRGMRNKVQRKELGEKFIAELSRIEGGLRIHRFIS